MCDVCMLRSLDWVKDHLFELAVAVGGTPHTAQGIRGPYSDGRHMHGRSVLVRGGIASESAVQTLIDSMLERLGC